MSINWVMTTPTEAGFVKLPHERILYQSQPRTTLDISTPNPFPGTQPYTLKCDAGLVYLTNQRIVYLPSNSTTELKSFSTPILNLQDSHARAPFFGANYWTSTCKPVAGGGIPPLHPLVELRLTFKEGGAFDFHAKFEQIKERALQAQSVARDMGQGEGNLLNVHLDQLPAYEAAKEENGGASTRLNPTSQPDRSIGGRETSSAEVPTRQEAFASPNEPPPGYEEAQAQAVDIHLDQRLRDEAARQ